MRLREIAGMTAIHRLLSMNLHRAHVRNPEKRVRGWRKPPSVGNTRKGRVAAAAKDTRFQLDPPPGLF